MAMVCTRVPEEGPNETMPCGMTVLLGTTIITTTAMGTRGGMKISKS